MVDYDEMVVWQGSESVIHYRNSPTLRHRLFLAALQLFRSLFACFMRVVPQLNTEQGSLVPCQQQGFV
jgi:hypothetical protein